MALILRLMPSEKRRKRRRKLKDLKLLILTAFSSEIHYNGDSSIVLEALPASVFYLKVANTRLLAPLTRRQ